MDNSVVSNAMLGKSTSRVRRTMVDILIALTPATVAAIVFGGLQAALIIAVCVGGALLSEFLFNVICKQKQTATDLSAVVTGLLLALNLPVGVTLWQCLVGAVFAIVIVKCAFGGLGRNIVNPAVAAIVMLLIAFELSGDAIASFAGREVFLVTLAIGGVYLLIRRAISWAIPVVYIGGVFLLCFALTGNAMTALGYVLSGGVVIGAIFMATDPVTSPKKCLGKIIFALGCAVLTVLITFYGKYPQGAVAFAILLMNIICPYIDGMFEKKTKTEEVTEA